MSKLAELAELIGWLVISASFVWVGGVALYGGCYLAARLIDWWKEKP